MRKIKYQGWNGNRMLTVVRIHLDSDGAIWWSDDFKQLRIYNAEHNPLREYTGLKDKNGKEIYEGDIFKQKGMDDELIVGEVIFDEGYHGFRVKEGEYIYHWLKFAGEVLGNIYENFELLNRK